MLKGPDKVRLRPGVIFGSDGVDGCLHSVFEIISNSVDEAREGFGNLINVTVNSDYSVTVEDFGRGVPLDYNEKEKRYNWELVYCELYAGGKYSNNDGGGYEYSIGLNGLGACATQFSSEYMHVQSYRDGFLYEIDFKKGFAVGELRKRPLTKKEKRTGTVINWKPDVEVFTSVEFSHEELSEILHKQAIVNSGVKFVLKWQPGNEDGSYTEQVHLYDNGILDYVEELAGDEKLTDTVVWHGDGVGRDREDMEDYKLKFDIAFCFTKTTSYLEYFHNSSYLEHGGSPEKAVKSAFVFAIDKYCKSVNKTKTEIKILFGDIEDSLVIVINSLSTKASYENQTKKAISNKFIYDYLNAFMRRNLEIYFAENPDAAEKILKQILLNKRSREAAEKARIDVGKLLATPNDPTIKIEKFVDCRSKNPEERELYIVEGDSALTSVKLARSAEFQAVMPVRGKTLNCLKSSPEKILKSQIITDLLKIMGCGAAKASGKRDSLKFDATNLRFSKIIICTDGDEDGFQIRTLILTMFYRLLPTIIKDGKVFIAESPLYEITCGDETKFAYNEKDKAEIARGFGSKKFTLQRSKGLGENTPEMMQLTTMSPATRRLIRVCPTDENSTYRMFDTLLGNNIEARKEFIHQKASFYLKDADI